MKFSSSQRIWVPNPTSPRSPWPVLSREKTYEREREEEREKEREEKRVEIQREKEGRSDQKREVRCIVDYRTCGRETKLPGQSTSGLSIRVRLKGSLPKSTLGLGNWCNNRRSQGHENGAPSHHSLLCRNMFSPRRLGRPHVWYYYHGQRTQPTQSHFLLHTCHVSFLLRVFCTSTRRL